MSRSRKLDLPRCHTLVVFGAALWCSLGGVSLEAQNKAPELGYLFPPVVRAGGQTDALLGGYDLTSDVEWFVHDEGVTLTPLGPPGEFVVPPPPYWFGERGRSAALPIPREVPVRVVVSPDVAVGWVRYQVVNANGASATARFLVSDQPEVVETRDREKTQRLDSIPVNVSGRLSRIAEVDRYEIQADRTGPLMLDLYARRLGSDFNGMIRVYDAAGTLVADVADTEGLDPNVTFAARRGESYHVHLQDIDHRGNRAYIYRLAVAYEADRQRLKPAEVERLTKEQPVFEHRFSAKKGETWQIAAKSRAIGTRLDLALSVEDSHGKRLQNNDDLPGTTDAGLEFKAPADGEYRCLVNDLSGRDFDLDSVFRFTCVVREPDFELSVPQQVKIPAGGSATLTIKALRHAGMDSPIAIRIEGLPDHVTIPDPLEIPAGKTSLKVQLTANADGGSSAALIRVFGKATHDGREVSRPAFAPAGGNLSPRDPLFERVTGIALSTTLKPRFELQLIDKNRQRAVHRGTTYPAPFIVAREDGFQGIVRLLMAARQGRHRQGITGPVIEVPPDVQNTFYPCFLPQWLETDRTTRMVVLGMAEQKDGTGRVRQILRPADARVTMILEGALLGVEHQAPERKVRAGESVDVPILVRRSTKLEGPVEISIRTPAELSDLITLRPGGMDGAQDRQRVRIQTRKDPRLTGRWLIQILATGHQSDTWPVIAETDLMLEFTPPEEASASARTAPADAASTTADPSKQRDSR